MTYMQRERNDSMDTTLSLEKNQRADNRKIKKFLTNTDKSVFNLKWEVGGVAEQSYQRSRSPSQRNKKNSSSQPQSPKRRYYRSELNNQLRSVSNSDTSQPSEQPIAYYYPYAYPPMPVQEQSGKRLQKMYKSRTIKQSDKSVNLLRNRNQLKIEHHYVDSPIEAQKLIHDLRRRGFIETGIETPGTYSKEKRK